MLHQSRLALVMLGLWLALPVSPAMAGLWRVEADSSGDVPTVQAAINAAAPGDTVELGPGDYAEALLVLGTPLVLRGTGDPEITVLRGDRRRKILTVDTVSQGLIVENLAFVEGVALGVEFPENSGGAITALASPLVIRRCVFRGNQSLGPGGAIYESATRFPGAPTPGPAQTPFGLHIEDSLFETGFAGDEGGAVFSALTPVSAFRCTFRDNQGLLGGALSVLRQSMVLEDCEFRGNRARLDGGGVMQSGIGPAVITDCVFVDNHGPRRGGGVHLFDVPQATLTRCDFLGNTAGTGGGLQLHRTPAVVSHCLWADCVATEAGGGVLVDQSTGGQWTRCTWIDNQAPVGASLSLDLGETAVFNSVVADTTDHAVVCRFGSTITGDCNGRGSSTTGGCLEFDGLVTVERCPSEPGELCAVPSLPDCGPVGHADIACGDPACSTPVEPGTWGSLKLRFR